MHHKVNMLILLIIYPNRAILRRGKNLIILLSFLVFMFSSPIKKIMKNYYNNISLPWVLAFVLPEQLFCLSHHKTRWTMLVDNVSLEICLLGTSNSMVTLTFCPWCTLKWSRNKFNNQSHILQGLGTVSWSMM